MVNQSLSDPRLKSKEWRLNNLYKIINKDGGLVTFKLNHAQEIFFRNRHNRNVIPKSRQLGITTFSVIDMLDEVLFTPNYKAVLIAHDYKSMSEIFEKVQIAWEQFPSALKSAIGWEEKTDNKNRLSFNNYSSITVTLSTRSGTVNYLHISEFGKICKEYPNKATEILRGSLPSVVPNGIINIESTVEEAGGLFKEFYDDAVDEVTNSTTSQDFLRFFFPWTMEDKYFIDPKYVYSEVPLEFKEYQLRNGLSDGQICWYYKTMKNAKLDWEGMFRQYPTTVEEAFSSSKELYFNGINIKRRIDNDVVKPSKVFGDWVIYDEYKRNHLYAIGADPAEGVGRDHSAAVLIDFSHRLDNYQIVPKVVGVYKNNRRDPLEFAYDLSELGHIYGRCLIAPERNNHGHAVIGKLKEIYPTIYKQRVKDYTEDREVDRYGWATTASTKPELLSQLRLAVDNNEIIIPDSDLLHELLSYGDEDYKRIKNDPKVTNHFDMVMALAIAWEMRGHAIGAYDSEPEYTTGGMSSRYSMFEV